ncbi:MAG TPA: hypothetical protein PLQ65_13205 [Flavihumibacter sp.]|nr:hypothetical protein [Flavihumibacter sp.]
MKNVVIALCFILVAGAASAQDNDRAHKSAEERAKAQSDKMKTELALTDDQYTKIYDLNLKYAKKNEEIRGGTDDKMAKMKASQAAMQEKDAAVKAILDAGQYEKYEAMKADRKDKMKEHRRH